MGLTTTSFSQLAATTTLAGAKAVVVTAAGTDAVVPLGTANGLCYFDVTGTPIGNSAPLAAPAFTGIPTAPTAAIGTNSTQLATTAYVDRYSSANAGAFIPTTGQTVTPVFTGEFTVVQVNPAGTLANLTLTLGVGTIAGQVCYVAFSQIITALAVTTTNVTATGGFPLPTAAAANQTFGFTWSAASSKWTRFL